MRKGIGYYFKIYGMIVSQDIKSKMHYRADFYISSIGMVATNVAGFLTFWLIFQSFPSILGWSFYEMLFLYGFTLLAISPSQIFFDNVWPLSGHVHDGSFIKYCFRPLNLFFYYMSEVFDLKGLSQVAFGTVTLVYAWYHLKIEVTFGTIAVLLLVLLAASLVMIAIMVVSAASSFWIIQSHSIVMFMNKFKDFAKYPVTIYNTSFKFLFTFIIPIGFISFYPSMIFLRPEDMNLLTWISPVMGIIFFYLAYRFWMYGAMKYSGTGS